MLNKHQSYCVGFLVIFLSLISKVAFAAGSGADRIETPDAGAMGMGSAFVGEADTPAAIYYNPAGINQMSRPEISVGEAIIAPRAQMTQPNGNVVHEQNNEYSVPNFYVVVPVKPGKFTVGLSGGSNWGLGTNWGPDSALRYATTQAKISDIDNSLVAAYQVTDQWSLAVSADHDYSKADESKVYSNASFGGAGDGGFELRGSDDAWGYRVATMFKINDKNQIGLMYRSRINITYTGKAIVDGISPTLDAVAGFSGPTFITRVTDKAVLPQSVVLGYSFKPTTKWTLNFDLEWMDWSSTKYQTLTYPDATAQQMIFFGAGTYPTPEDWHSAVSEAFGTQYDLTDRFRVRAGYYHHPRVIPQFTFNPNLPDSSSNGITAGFGFDLTKRLTLDVAYSALFYESRDINNTVASGTINGKYSVFTNIGLVSLTYKF